MNVMRLSKDSVAVGLSWLLTGLILLLVCLFSALIVRDYGRENEADSCWWQSWFWSAGFRL